MKKIITAFTLAIALILGGGASTASASATSTPVAKGHPQWAKDRVITVSVTAPRKALVRSALVEFTRASQTKFKIVTHKAALNIDVRELPGDELGRGSFKADRRGRIYSGSVTLDVSVRDLDAISARSVVMHNLGHAFGLKDSLNPASVMAPVPSGNIHLSYADLAALRPVDFRATV